MDNPTPQSEQPEGQPLDLSGLVKEGKILGKYDSPEAAEQGYWNAVEGMNKAKEQLNMAMQVIQAMQSGQPAQPQTQVQASYEKNLHDMGIPVQDLNAFVQARAEEVATKLLQQHLSPMVQGASARSEMEQVYPDFKDNEAAILRNVKTNQDLAKEFDELLEKGAPKAALKLAYFHWKTTSAPRPDPAIEAAKRAAQGPSQAGSPSRTPGMSAGPSKAEEDAAYQAFYAGDAVPLFNLKMRNMPLTYSEQMEALMRGRI